MIYWGLGIGDWGLGIGQSPIPNPLNYKIRIRIKKQNDFLKQLNIFLRK